jgi:hypothetical protein
MPAVALTGNSMITNARGASTTTEMSGLVGLPWQPMISNQKQIQNHPYLILSMLLLIRHLHECLLTRGGKVAAKATRAGTASIY